MTKGPEPGYDTLQQLSEELSRNFARQTVWRLGHRAVRLAWAQYAKPQRWGSEYYVESLPLRVQSPLDGTIDALDLHFQVRLNRTQRLSNDFETVINKRFKQSVRHAVPQSVEAVLTAWDTMGTSSQTKSQIYQPSPDETLDLTRTWHALSTVSAAGQYDVPGGQFIADEQGRWGRNFLTVASHIGTCLTFAENRLSLPSAPDAPVIDPSPYDVLYVPREQR